MANRSNKWKMVRVLFYAGCSSAEVNLVPESWQNRKKWRMGSQATCRDSMCSAIMARFCGEWKSSFVEQKRCPGDTAIVLNNAAVLLCHRKEREPTWHNSAFMFKTESDCVTHHHTETKMRRRAGQHVGGRHINSDNLFRLNMQSISKFTICL